jgi:hypothetical protein
MPIRLRLNDKLLPFIKGVYYVGATPLAFVASPQHED